MNTLIERTQWPATESIFYPQEGLSAYFNATGFDTFGCYDKCKKTHPVDLIKRSKCRKRCDTEADQFFELEKAKLAVAPELGFNQAVASLAGGAAGPEMRVDGAEETDNTALIVGVFIFLLMLGGAGYWYYSKSTVVAPIAQ